MVVFTVIEFFEGCTKSMNEQIACGDIPLQTASAADKIEVKARLSEALPVLKSVQVADLLDRLWSLGMFQVRRGPETGLVMYRVRDPFDTEFHLGEVLLCETEVTLDGHSGWGMVSGDEPERALLLASVEAAQASGNSLMLDIIVAFLKGLGKKSGEQGMLMSRLAASTAVRFESMKKETVDFGSLGE
jgi:phosphonate C-P lyase system protein PhnG